MINVEGDYEEIVRYLNTHRANGVQHARSHGDFVFAQTEDSEEELVYVQLNVGLFSLIEDCREDDEDLRVLGNKVHVCDFHTKIVTIYDGTAVPKHLEIENPETTHLIRF